MSRAEERAELAKAMDAFDAFCRVMTITSKEALEMPLRLNRPQKYLREQIRDALSHDVHTIYVVKARQLGVTTFTTALSLFWLLYFPTMKGALVADRDDNKEVFRELVSRYILTLPEQWKSPVKTHNRHQLVFASGSAFEYLVASARSSELGRSRGLALLHGTECAYWKNEDGAASLKAALAEKNWRRLNIWESTSCGFNWWHDEVVAAQEDPTARVVFLAWWMHDDYAVLKSDPRYKVYWDGSLTESELSRCREVLQRYGHKITTQQLAWWRWKSATNQSPIPLEQKYPWTAEESFVSSGNAFFPSKTLVEVEKAVAEAPTPFKPLSYRFGQSFGETELVAAEPGRESLRIYEDPDPAGKYVIGFDPAYGRSDAGDDHCITVLRCYSDRIDIAAVYATNAPDCYQATWVLAHLAACYRDCIVNLEIGGPGAAVMMSLKALRDNLRAQSVVSPMEPHGVPDVLRAMRWYLYKRPDSMGAGYVINWKTTSETKQQVLTAMRDAFTLGILRVRDPDLLFQMRKMVRIGQSIMGEGAHDDRVMSCALGLRAWEDHVRPRMVRMGQTYAALHKPPTTGNTMVAGIIGDHFRRVAAERRAQSRMRAWQ